MRQWSAMQRVRRLISLMLIAVIAAPLGACQSRPDIAAYVDNVRYTQHEVDHITQEITDIVNEMPPTQGGQVDRGRVRQVALGTLVVRDLARKVARNQSIDIPATNPYDALNALGVTDGSQLSNKIITTSLARVIADTSAVLGALARATSPVEPTEDDQKEIYTNLRYNGESIPDPFEEVRQFLTKESIGISLGVRNTLRDAARQYHVVVNPKYAPLSYEIPMNIGQVDAYVSLSLVSR